MTTDEENPEHTVEQKPAVTMKTFDDLNKYINNMRTTTRTNNSSSEVCDIIVDSDESTQSDDVDDDYDDDDLEEDDDGSCATNGSKNYVLMKKSETRYLKRLCALNDVYKCIKVKDEAATRIYSELVDIYNSQDFKNGLFDVRLQNGDLFRWNWTAKFMDKSSLLYSDLKIIRDENRGDGLIRFVVHFGKSYPFMPPIILITTPEIDGYEMPNIDIDWFGKLRKKWSCHLTIQPTITEIMELIGKKRIKECAEYPRLVSVAIANVESQRRYSQLQPSRASDSIALGPRRIESISGPSRDELRIEHNNRIIYHRQEAILQRILQEQDQQQRPENQEQEQAGNQHRLEGDSLLPLRQLIHQRLRREVSHQEGELQELDRRFEQMSRGLEILERSVHTFDEPLPAPIAVNDPGDNSPSHAEMQLDLYEPIQDEMEEIWQSPEDSADDLWS